MRSPILAAIAVLAHVLPAHADSQPLQRLSLDDVLQLESFGEATFSPEGSRVAYERRASKMQRPGSTYDSGSEDLTVHVVELATGEQVEVKGADSEARYSLAPWGAPFSADGRFLALRAMSVERAGFAIWDAQTRTLRMLLPGEMKYTFFPNAWTRDGRYIYATAAPGDGMASHPVFARRLSERWNEVWKGSSAQVLVMSANPAVQQSEPPAGALVIARAATGETVEIARGTYTKIVLSPDGRRFAAIRVGLPTTKQTFSVLGTGELQIFALTSTGAELEARFPEMDIAWQRLVWSPDGRKLAVGGYPVQVAGAVPDSASEFPRLYLYDAHARTLADAGLRQISLSQSDGNTSFGIAPIGWLGSTPLAIGIQHDAAGTPAGVPWSESERRHYDYGDTSRSDLWAVTSRGPRKLTEFARTSTLTFADPEGYGAVFVVADGALWRLQLDGPPERLTPSAGPTVVGFFFPSRYGQSRDAFAPATARIKHGRAVQLQVERDGKTERMVFDLKSLRFSSVPAGQLLAAARDYRSTLVLTKAGHATALTLDAPTLSSAAVPRELARVNEFLNARVEAQIVPLDYTLAGRNVRSWVVLPPGQDPSVPVPAVLHVYGGSVWNQTSTPTRYARLDFPLSTGSGQLMAAHGYAMIYPSLPTKPAAEADVPALLAEGAIAAIDAAAAQGLIDPQRVAVMGGSFGGYATAAILSRRSDRFRAGIAISGIYDFIAGYGSTFLQSSLAGAPYLWRSSMDDVEAGQINLREPPWRAPEAYMRNSPLFSVEHLDTPLMIVQSDLDYDITSLYGAERMYAALVRAGKKPVFVRYWGEGHGVSSAPNVRDQWARVLAWLDAHLRE